MAGFARLCPQAWASHGKLVMAGIFGRGQENEVLKLHWISMAVECLTPLGTLEDPSLSPSQHMHRWIDSGLARTLARRSVIPGVMQKGHELLPAWDLGSQESQLNFCPAHLWREALIFSTDALF